jgi:hypothetical protein
MLIKRLLSTNNVFLPISSRFCGKDVQNTMKTAFGWLVAVVCADR